MCRDAVFCSSFVGFADAIRVVKQIPPWASLPDSSGPLRSEPPVWKVEKHQELANGWPLR